MAVEDGRDLRPDQQPPQVRRLEHADGSQWNATILEGDVAEEVAKIKQEPAETILKYGTGELDRALMEHNLVDEFHFWLFPVAAGAGQRLFDGIDLTTLSLIETTRFKSGIVVLTYAPQ